MPTLNRIHCRFGMSASAAFLKLGFICLLVWTGVLCNTWVPLNPNIIPENLEDTDFQMEGLKISSKQISTIVNGFSSAPRMFFAVFRAPRPTDPYYRFPNDPFCGATIIHKYWVISSARCASESDPKRQMFVETGDFTVPNGPRKSYGIERWFISHELNTRDHYNSAVILLKLRTPIEDPLVEIIPLCEAKPKETDLLGVCGMGLNSTTTLDLPDYLQQTFLTQSSAAVETYQEKLKCRKHLVCVKSASVFGHSHICTFDEGDPLFTFECNSYVPKCLLGVAAFHWRIKGHQRLTCQESFFTSIPYLYNWINNIISTY